MAPADGFGPDSKIGSCNSFRTSKLQDCYTMTACDLTNGDLGRLWVLDGSYQMLPVVASVTASASHCL